MGKRNRLSMKMGPFGVVQMPKLQRCILQLKARLSQAECMNEAQWADPLCSVRVLLDRNCRHQRYLRDPLQQVWENNINLGRATQIAKAHSDTR